MLRQLVYSSRATRPLSSEHLEEILDDARRGNLARDVTGALVYADGVFLQVLEGEADVLDSLLASIRADTRHEALKVFFNADITRRAFEDWRMAYLDSETHDVAGWVGLDGSVSLDALLAQVHRDKQLVPRILVNIVEALAQRSQREQK